MQLSIVHLHSTHLTAFQCEGSKAWNLWENSLSLPENHSSDIARSSLPVKSTHVLLQPGDMLYLPRGTIHEALAQSSFSTHITISVYQQYNMKKLLLYLTPKLLDSAFAKNYELRKGLPLRLSNKLGTYVGLQESCYESHVNKNDNKGDAKQPSTQLLHDRNERNRWRKGLVDDVKQLMQSLCDEVCLQLLDETADDISSDFVMHRLPPPDLPSVDDEILEEDSFCVPRKLLPQTVVRVCDPTSMFCKVIEDNGAIMLALAHNKCNSRTTHMGHPDHRDFMTPENVSNH